MFDISKYIDSPNTYEGKELSCTAEIEVLQKTAAVHTQGVNPDFLFKDYALADSSVFREARSGVINRSKLTLKDFQIFMSNVSESLHFSAVDVKYTGENKQNENEKIATYLNQSGFWDEVQKRLIPRQIDSPNDFVVVMPETDPENPKVPKTKLWVVHASDVVRIGPEFLEFNRNTEFSDAGTYILSKTFIGRREDIAKNEEDESRYIWDFTKSPLTKNPFVQFGGLPAEKRSEGLKGSESYYLSFVQGAFETATLAYVIGVDVELLRQLHIHPITTVLAPTCTGCDGKGIEYNTGIDGADTDCTTCQGKGVITPSLRLGEIIAYKGNNIDMGNPEARIAAHQGYLEFHAPELGAYEAQRTTFNEQMALLKESLAAVFVHNVQSGVAKEMDRLDRAYLINEIGVHFYTVVVKTLLQAIKEIRSFDREPIVMETPDSFAGEKISVILETINELKKSGAPAAQLFPEYERLYKRQYSDNPVTFKQAIFSLYYDPLSIMSEMADKKIAGSPYEFEYSKQLPSVLARIAQEMGDKAFLEMENEALYKKTKEMIKEPEPEKPLTDGSEFNTK